MELNPLNWTAAPFLGLYTGLALAVFALGILLRSALGAGAERRPQLNALEWAYLAGGPDRVGDVALLSLVAKGGGAIDAKTHRINVADAQPLMSATGDRLHLAFEPNMTRQQFQSAVQPLIATVRARLEALGYAPSDDDMNSFRRSILPFVAALLALGTLKAIVGAGRGHPVGILVILLVVTAVAAVFLGSRPLRTRAGAEAYRAHRAANARAARAPLDRELLLAVALSGPVILSGTEFAPVYAARRNSSGGDSGSGCSGGGCGGGGCGGCS